MNQKLNHAKLLALTEQIKNWGGELGLNGIGITDTDLTGAEANLMEWLGNGFHGEMNYMAKHGTKRCHPSELEPCTSRIISVRLDYLPEPLAKAEQILHDTQQAFIARYALGRDYHKLLRKRLQKLADRIKQVVPAAHYRVYVDSAPVMEKPLAQKAGLDWIGKHTNLIAKEASSWFFLGEIYTNIPLICDQPAQQHCGDCEICISSCPTQAIIAPYQLDARRCISYLTIELQGSIPEHLRTAIGNRIFGCDDCMQVCPWNRFAQLTKENDFLPRASLDSSTLVRLFDWDEATFLKSTEGSAIRRLGHLRWLRNIAVALGNTQTTAEIITSLSSRLNHDSALLVEHVSWAFAHHQGKRRKWSR
ncbi:MAG: tRNA epoxyqueuosine(34) reductase QueG [Candidatus Thiodiazotropha sp. (ex Lucinoma aequizonata)]|nr:tRNA epoxyqueuosine(34) reductase QueG [Candidatus Thiodiazotropha sp. (ex Lucinoma aequizonata)]MCU7899857.1 tRNA epoxyqueuosine(34) reductase QueG [Candidatus Thiodiazotropha sp. (ex Lucinoma aequizonata)]MCU7910159.1 tRNA epoxyqueuosine(34) reductase QueG [Candidatus Thiodiazotropha sp. (ex Lucinoma aequizonata)]MCU7911833.1 tRNA epoxyqueuosine(34) reductase QueG [Candidatus Thiodiazotropha sp. (ex Lucinoma aequizonata)]